MGLERLPTEGRGVDTILKSKQPKYVILEMNYGGIMGKLWVFVPFSSVCLDGITLMPARQGVGVSERPRRGSFPAGTT